MSRFRQRGYSLVELLVTIAIIAVLLGLMLVGFSFIQKKQKKKQAHLELSALQVGITSYREDFGDFPHCPKEICTPAECLFLSMIGFHNAVGGLEVPPKRASLPVRLLGFDPAIFDEAEIPSFSHNDGNALKIWLSDILNKDPGFLDPWGNEYQYEYPQDDDNLGYQLFSMGPDGQTGDKFSGDDIYPR